ncbi:MAG: hypothetical protein ABIF71_03230 [Planctomycetota bacterium]
MKKGHLLTEDQLIKGGIQALMANLGPVETSRFLALPVARKVESITRHRQWQRTLNKATFFKKVFSTQS